MKAFQLMLVMIAAVSCARFRSEHHKEPSKEGLESFRLFFEEATGMPLVIETAKGHRWVTLDAAKSDPEALATFQALKAEVLYPNAEGKITLQGTLSDNGQSLALKHWFLPRSFNCWRFPASAQDHLVQTRRTCLTAGDFNIDLTVKAPHFTPEKHLHPLVPCVDVYR